MVSVLKLRATGLAAVAALALWATPAAADCTGQFGSGAICNNPDGSTKPPIPTANPTIGTANSTVTVAGRVVTSASTTARAGLNLPHGVAPTSPVNGDLWTTTSGLFVRINGATIGPLTSAGAGSFAGTSPITVSFPASVVTYAFDFTVANSFLATQTFRTILAGTTNTYDIGTSATVAAFRTIYAGTSFVGPIGTFTTSVAVGGATIGSDALGVTGTATVSGTVTGGAFIPTSSSIPSDGMYLNSAGQTAFAAGGVRIFFFNSTGLLMANASGATLSSSAAAAATPTMIPRRSDSGTGIGSAGTASLSLIATSVEQLRINNGSLYVGGAATGTNTAAVAPTISAALSTGTATNPDLVFQTGVATVSGTGQATATTGFTIKGETQALLATGNLTIKTATAIPAGGAAGVGYLFSSTANFGTFFGSGAPTLSAAQGSIYLRSDGAAGTLAYINNNGSTGWTAIGAAGITALTGDVTASGSGSVAATLATAQPGAHTWALGQTYSSAMTYGGVTLANSVTGTGSMVLGTSPTIASLTVTGAFTATGLVTNADLVNASTTVNGTTCTLGSTCTITAVAGTITVGTTVVAGGTSPRILYDNAGVLGEYTLTGSGTVVVMQTSPTLITPVLGVATGTSLALGGATIGGNAFAVTGSAAISSTLTSARHLVTSTSSTALAVGAGGATNPAFAVDASTASSATGIQVKSAAAAGGAALSVLSSGTDENLTIDAKGAGTINIGSASTGAITLTRATTMSNALTYGGVTLSNSVIGTGSMMLGTVGTWTPTLIGSSGGAYTYTLQVGSYEIIGRQVTLRFQVVGATAGTATGNLQVGGFPVASANVSSDVGICFISNYSVTGLGALNYGITADVQPNTSVGRFLSNASTTANFVTVTQAGGTPSLSGWCNYRSS